MRARLVALVEARAARRRARIVAALEAAGVAAVVEGAAVRASAPGLAARWWRDLAVRDAGRNGL
ncbi:MULTISPECIES: hypothetical protein [Sphingobium]|nr:MULTISPECIES: hypothetical protein [Sphingobium]RYM08653.1 hypothetical protein EWH12_16120 [Sphingobium cupriresistens]WCP14709.1 hypothetical protein sphantq_03158 [Sphingobium sp. AntQ-1]